MPREKPRVVASLGIGVGVRVGIGVATMAVGSLVAATGTASADEAAS